MFHHTLVLLTRDKWFDILATRGSNVQSFAPVSQLFYILRYKR